MDSVKSIKGYGKVDEAQDLALKRKTTKQLILFCVSIVVLVGIIIGSVVALHSRRNNSPHPTPSSIPELTPAASLRTVCEVTRYPASCISSISKLLPSSNTTTTDEKIIFRLSLKVALDELNSISDLRKKLAAETTTDDDERIKSALGVCGDLFHEAIDRVNETVSAMDDVVGEDGKKKKKNILNSTEQYCLRDDLFHDLQTWISAAVTYQDTCLNVLSQNIYANSAILQTLKSAMINSTEFTSNSLAIVKIFL